MFYSKKEEKKANDFFSYFPKLPFNFIVCVFYLLIMILKMMLLFFKILECFYHNYGTNKEWQWKK